MRLTEEQYTQLMRSRAKAPAEPKLSKFRNVRCQSADGKKFASKLERDYYEKLLLRQKAGDVKWFIRQPSFELEGGVVYRADFLVVTATDVEVIDTKGVLTQVCKNKLKQVRARYGIDVTLVGARRELPADFEVRPI